MMQTSLSKSRSADNLEMDLDGGLSTRRGSSDMVAMAASSMLAVPQRRGSSLFPGNYRASPLSIRRGSESLATVVSQQQQQQQGSGASLSPMALERIKTNRREGICVDDWDWRRYLIENAMTRANNAYTVNYNPSLRCPVPCPISEPLDDTFVSQLTKIVLID